jgi:hypothetical protein
MLLTRAAMLATQILVTQIKLRRDLAPWIVTATVLARLDLGPERRYLLRAEPVDSAPGHVGVVDAEQGSDVDVGPAELGAQYGGLRPPGRVVVDVSCVRLVVAEAGVAADVMARGAHRSRLDPGPVEVGVEVGTAHAGLSSSPADLEPLGGGQAPEPGCRQPELGGGLGDGEPLPCRAAGCRAVTLLCLCSAQPGEPTSPTPGG